MIIIRLIGTAAGVPTEFDGQYVKAYNPTLHRADGSYDGGLLQTTTNPAEAWRFRNTAEALLAYRWAFGLDVDGRPNRPLTAWTVEFVTWPPSEESI